ncbi:carboxypeptidase-like regulatory domain-containing protein [Pseudomonas sp. SO81]|uniref:carboxypeptidase-like regulatory domain-containing protein n=1 Tax=Pseudomonas sp. SO81 TaxID=2983246 RepID=UPI00338EB7DD|nr:hypothetical protein OH686_00795 [Pseudomonas sp. SO81]
MNKLILSVCALLLSGCINIAVSPQAKGRVTDSEGNPVSATIVLQHSQLESSSETTETDEDGTYSVGELRVWTPIPFAAIKIACTITISAPGFKSASYEATGYDELTRDIVLERE